MDLAQPAAAALNTTSIRRLTKMVWVRPGASRRSACRTVKVGMGGATPLSQVLSGMARIERTRGDETRTEA